MRRGFAKFLLGIAAGLTASGSQACELNDNVSAAGLERELAIVNSRDHASAFDAYISTFDPEARVHSL